MRFLVFLVLLCTNLIFNSVAFANPSEDTTEVDVQDGKGVITGQVLDESDLPLPRVMIKVKNTVDSSTKCNLLNLFVKQR